MSEHDLFNKLYELNRKTFLLIYELERREILNKNQISVLNVGASDMYGRIVGIEREYKKVSDHNWQLGMCKAIMYDFKEWENKLIEDKKIPEAIKSRLNNQIEEINETLSIIENYIAPKKDSSYNESEGGV